MLLMIARSPGESVLSAHVLGGGWGYPHLHDLVALKNVLSQIPTFLMWWHQGCLLSHPDV